MSSLTTNLQHTQQKLCDAKEEIKEARSEITTIKKTAESQKTEITSLQGFKTEVGQLRNEKAELHQKFDNAKLNHAAVANTLTQTKKKNEGLERQNKELDQRFYRTGQERDAANAAVEKLKVQIKQHEVDKCELDRTISKLEENLREEARVADMFRDCAAQLDAKRDIPQAPDKCSDGSAVKTPERDAKESSTSERPACHATPPSDNSNTATTAVNHQAPDDGSNIFVAPVASMKPSQPSKSAQITKKIGMPLANNTPVKSKAPKVKSPLVSMSSDSAQEDPQSSKAVPSTSNTSSSTGGTGKRKRSVTEEQQDPRLVKQSLTGSRRLSSENFGTSGRHQSSRPAHAHGRRSPEGDPYARRW